MNAERALTVALVALLAGSTTLFITLTVVGALTDGADALRFGLSIGLGLAVAVGVGYAVDSRATDGQLTGR